MRVLTLLIMCGSTACASSLSFVQTGDLRSPRADESWVQPYLSGPPSETYHEIGVVDVRGRNLKQRVERASEIAREKGGNAIVLLNSRLKVNSNTVVNSTAIQPFFGFGSNFAFGTGFSSNSRTYEIDRYAVIHLDDPVKKPSSKQLSVLHKRNKDGSDSIGPRPDQNRLQN